MIILLKLFYKKINKNKLIYSSIITGIVCVRFLKIVIKNKHKSWHNGFDKKKIIKMLKCCESCN